VVVQSLQSFWDAMMAFGDRISEVGLGALLIALAFYFGNLLLRATAWRNILAAAHPEGKVRWRSITGSYLAGVGANSLLPVRGGDVIKVYLAHRSMPGAAYTTIATSLIAETVFDVLVGSILIAAALWAGEVPYGTDIFDKLDAFEWTLFADHGRAFFIGLAILLIAIGVFLGWIEHHVTSFWDRVKHGLAILTQPRRYLQQVVSLQAIGWGCRVAAMYFFLQAFNIPAGVDDAALALAAGSLATLMPVTPGGVGPQQALLVYMFSGVASRSAVLAFSVGMQVAVTLSTALVGGICIAVMLRQVPWRANVPKPDAPPPATAER
jgi:uncharacterized membrane protein YbhN (UPF0104 family)